MSDIDRVVNQPPPVEEPDLGQWHRDITDELNSLDKTVQTQQFFPRENDPSDPIEGSTILWMTAAGDLKVKVTIDDVTKTTTLVDFSSL